jgi:hypothetical protein
LTSAQKEITTMHQMQFRLFSLSYLNWRILANLAKVVVDRGLREARLWC